MLRAAPKFKHLVFGGGGAKGTGLLGAICALEQNNHLLSIESYAGTSVGAIIAYNRALGIKPSFLNHFMGLPSGDPDTSRALKTLKPTNLYTIVERSKKQIYYPEGMFDLALTTTSYGLFGGDPLHISNALTFDHPVVLEELRLLTEFKKMIRANRSELDTALSKKETDMLLEVLENVEAITLGEWGQFIESLSRQMRDVTGLSHFSSTATKVNDVIMSPITFTSMPNTPFTDHSANVPMILAMAASASFPWSLPPVSIDALGIKCIDGGVFQNLMYTPKLFGEDETLLINLGHKKAQDAWDYRTFYNFSELNRIVMNILFKRRPEIEALYYDSVLGYPITPKMCLIGINEHAVSSNAKPIATLTPQPTKEQLIALYESAFTLTRRAIEADELTPGKVIVDFAGYPYGSFINSLREFN